MAIVMGTAGHIDHGKTALVRALTGIDCDRLEEEKRRGITIELGFAFCELPGGGRLGIVDVPGHEKFVRNMVAGASGIDFVMLVVAADEGVMPQTREHLEICSLLGIRHGLVALTKIDMVDAEWLDVVREDLANFLAGTFLEGAPVFPVSALTGEGIGTLRDYIVAEEGRLLPKRRTDLFRLPVDRVFSLKGYGTVVTGTMISGKIRSGDAVTVLPQGLESRARSLQSHGESVEEAHAGHRTAVNLPGLEVEQIRRGDVLALPGTLFPSDRWLIRLTCLSSSPRGLRNRAEIHFHHGAAERAARLRFWGRDRLNPGETALCEARLDAPLVGVFGDHCVVRAFSPLRTVAGGLLVHPLGLPLRGGDEENLSRLLSLPDLEPLELTRAQIELASTSELSFSEISVLTNLDSRTLEKILRELSERGAIVCVDRESRTYLSSAVVRALEERCLAAAADFHRREPLKNGMTRGALLAFGKRAPGGAFAGASPKLAGLVVDRLIKAGKLVAEGEAIRLASHQVSLAADQEALRTTLLEAHARAGTTPPSLKEVLAALEVEARSAAPVVQMLVRDGDLVRVAEGMYYHAPVLADLRERLLRWFDKHGELDPAAFKELSGGLSRKYVIPLLEYFDRERLTLRVGDKRRLRGR